MKNKRISFLLFFNFAFFLVPPLNAQGPNTTSFDVLISFFSAYKAPYRLSTITLPFEGLSYNFNKILDRSFLDKDLKAMSGYKQDSFFSQKDISYLKSQVQKENELVRIDSCLLLRNNIAFIGPAKEQNEYKNRSGSVTKVTQPLFSIDGNKALFYLERYCGDGCGHGVVFLMEKQKGKWVVVHNRKVWAE